MTLLPGQLYEFPLKIYPQNEQIFYIFPLITITQMYV